MIEDLCDLKLEFVIPSQTTSLVLVSRVFYQKSCDFQAVIKLGFMRIMCTAQY